MPPLFPQHLLVAAPSPPLQGAPTPARTRARLCDVSGRFASFGLAVGGWALRWGAWRGAPRLAAPPSCAVNAHHPKHNTRTVPPPPSEPYRAPRRRVTPPKPPDVPNSPEAKQSAEYSALAGEPFLRADFWEQLTGCVGGEEARGAGPTSALRKNTLTLARRPPQQKCAENEKGMWRLFQ